MAIAALRPNSPILRPLWVFLWGPVSLLGAFIPLLILNPLQFPSLLLLPFSRTAFERYNRFIAFLVWGWWAFSMQRIIGMKVNVTGDALPEEEDAIVFANHQGMSDIPVILCLALMKGRVADVKWMVKDVLKFVPGVGWGMLFLGCIFLKRNWASDEHTIKEAFKRYTSGSLPLWLMSFPEGTRITPAKLAKARIYAAQRKLKPPSHVLLPRPSGFIASLEGLRGRVKAVYSVTIHYPGPKAPTLPQLIRGDLSTVDVHVRRFAIDALPQATEPLSTWLIEEFYDKDGRLAAFG